MHTTQPSEIMINATCPACGLVCDDIVVSATSPLTINQSCTKARAFFSQPAHTSSPQIRGQDTDLETAIQAAAHYLRVSKQPLFAGLGTEVQGMRAVMQLAEKTHATLDHMHSDATVRNTRTLQNTGWQTTTLTEIKNRADLIIAIGTDIISTHPRFFEKVVETNSALFKQHATEIAYLLAEPQSQPSLRTELPALINALHALARNQPLQAETVAGTSRSALMALLNRIKEAQYCVIVWSAACFNFPHAELSVQSLVRLIETLNLSTRVAGFPLNSGDGDTSVNSTSTWFSGFATRNRFEQGAVFYDNHAFSTQKQLETCDAVVWISTLKPHTPPKTTAPLIVLGHPNTVFEQTPEVFIPLGIPGLDHEGFMFRMDSAVTLPLKHIPATITARPKLSHLSAVCHRIMEVLAC